MTELINHLISLYANQLQTATYPTLAMTIMVIAIGLWIISYPRS